jgi:two-component system, chemotaxis family, CheB/CheR fusion protein
MTTRSTHRAASPAPDERGTGDASGTFPIVGIGASAGGLEAFTELLTHLPLDTGMAFVLVQHLDPKHESALAEILARATALPVQEVTDDLRVEANRVYVIPPNTDLTIEKGVLKLARRRRTSAPHRSIDTFFESLARDQRERAIGVVLSGSATDGTLGLEAIRAEGGITFAQDESARYDSMPRSAVAAGCVDFVLSPEAIARELAGIAKHPHVAETERPRRDDAPEAEGSFDSVLRLLSKHSGVDFSLYKPATIQRRITRRMAISKQSRPEDYARFLDGNAAELDALYGDALIGVTGFFRNPEAFDVLRRKVVRPLLEQARDEPVRVWVLGCSTGQEAYSIAMAFVEAAEPADRMRKLQVFATDVNEAQLIRARHGLYAGNQVQDLSPERLRRFFVEEQGGYRIVKSLREMVVFARQNLIGDPSFSRLDLISCRNLLIYLEPGLQKKVFPVLHYALKPGGFLFLGASESTGGFTDLFEAVDRKQKIYSKRAVRSSALELPIGKARGPEPSAHRSRARGRAAAPPSAIAARRGAVASGLGVEQTAQREADRVTVNRFAPPGVLVDADLRILQFRGSTSPYLEPPIGRASFDLLKMTREGLMLPLRAAISKAKKEGRAARQENVPVVRDGTTRAVNLEVIPLKNLREPGFLILFEDATKAGTTAALGVKGSRRKRSSLDRPPDEAARSLGAIASRRRIAELENELAETRDFLQSIQEQHEAANHELQASNEEVQSANEEFQSLNEELETSKEELESTNEELITVNEEMANRNAELNRLNSDLVNVQTSARLAIVLLGRDLTVRRFSAQAGQQLGLVAADVGRPFGNVRHQLDFPGLQEFIAAAIDDVSVRERELRDRDGCWLSLRVSPYLTLDHQVDGAVLVLVDIDDLKRGELAVAAARDYAEHIIETVREPLLVLDRELRVESANRSFYRTFGGVPAETVGRYLYDLSAGQWDIPGLHAQLEEILPGSRTLEGFQVEQVFEPLGRRTMLLNARRIDDPEGKSERVLLAIEDITERKQFEDALKQADVNKNEFLAMLAHELRGPLGPLRHALEIIRRMGGEESSGLERGLGSSAMGMLDPGHPIASAVEMMDRQLEQIVRLVDDLLDVSRISRGKIALRRERIELAPLVRHIVDAALPRIESAGLELLVTLPPEPILLDADATRLTQIVGNLLHNACKFTDRGGRIWLEVEDGGGAASGGVPDVVIRVRDTGIGIAAEELPRIFDMFAQVDVSLKRSADGLGIGLTLVKTLVEMHGGTVEAASAGVGRGAEFVVRLPALVEKTKPAVPVTGDPEARPTRILVVDDSRDAAESLAMLLQVAGHQTHCAYDGLEAVEAATSLQPDVILLDIGLPKLNGYEAARRIREQMGAQCPVLVALTGWGDEEDRRRSEEAGFDFHLVKPVGFDALTKLVTELKAPPIQRAPLRECEA